MPQSLLRSDMGACYCRSPTATAGEQQRRPGQGPAPPRCAVSSPPRSTDQIQREPPGGRLTLNPSPCSKETQAWPSHWGTQTSGAPVPHTARATGLHAQQDSPSEPTKQLPKEKPVGGPGRCAPGMRPEIHRTPRGRSAQRETPDTEGRRPYDAAPRGPTQTNGLSGEHGRKRLRDQRGPSAEWLRLRAKLEGMWKQRWGRVHNPGE